MVEGDPLDAKELSLFVLAATIVAQRRRIVIWTIAFGALAAVWVFTRRPAYVASASFVVQGGDSKGSGLGMLADQFGVSLPTGNATTSPQLYVTLLKSRVLLQPIVRGSWVAPELGGERRSLLDLLGVRQLPPARREEEGLNELGRRVTATLAKTSGVVEVQVSTPYQSVSLAIVRSLIDAVNEFNMHTRQTQGANERSFVEGRLAPAAASLHDAEDRMEAFLRSNREYATAPQLIFARERLQRELSLRMQVYTSLTQSVEEARIREVRDTPVTTLLDPPAVSAMPVPERRLLKVIGGLLFGGLFGVGSVLVRDSLARRREAGDSDLEAFLGTATEAKDDLLRIAPWSRWRAG